jgi:hypothetical protein
MFQTESASTFLHRQAQAVLNRAPLRPYGLLSGGGICYSPDGEAGSPAGSGESAATQTADDKPAPNPDLIPKSEAAKAFKARDAAKAQAARAEAVNRALAGKLGIDLDELEIADTGDEKNPVDIKGQPLDELTSTLSAARQQKLEGQKKAGKWEDRENELNAKHQKAIQKLSTESENRLKDLDAKATKRAAALESWIKETSVIGPIRQACAAEGAIDSDGDGSYRDIVKLIQDRVKAETKIDEESGKATVEVTPLAEDGTPMLDAKGNPASVQKMVGDFLDKRKHFRKSNYLPGPGAGSNGNGHGGRAALGQAEQGARAARILFGLEEAK